jgi:hypothetical protein
MPNSDNPQVTQILAELIQIEQFCQEGIQLARAALSQFPDNEILLQFFGLLSAGLFFVQSSRQRLIQLQGDLDSPEPRELLGTLLGTALETKIRIEAIVSRLRVLFP